MKFSIWRTSDSVRGLVEELLTASALEQAAAVRAGQVSALELAEAALAKAQLVSAELGAFTALDAEGAVDAARAIGAGDPRPFAGVPYAVKDLALPCVGLPLTNGSALFGDSRPGRDADGLPIGVQLLGRPTDERSLLALGTELERELPARVAA